MADKIHTPIILQILISKFISLLRKSTWPLDRGVIFTQNRTENFVPHHLHWNHFREGRLSGASMDRRTMTMSKSNFSVHKDMWMLFWDKLEDMLTYPLTHHIREREPMLSNFQDKHNQPHGFYLTRTHNTVECSLSGTEVSYLINSKSGLKRLNFL